jgi:hypothetical protein
LAIIFTQISFIRQESSIRFAGTKPDKTACAHNCLRIVVVRSTKGHRKEVSNKRANNASDCIRIMARIRLVGKNNPCVQSKTIGVGPELLCKLWQMAVGPNVLNWIWICFWSNNWGLIGDYWSFDLICNSVFKALNSLYF